MESKHKVIRDKYLRLKDERKPESAAVDRLLVQQAIRISNDRYGTDVCFAQELVKGYTRPVSAGTFPTFVPKEILEAHDSLIASRKLNWILKSKATRDVAVQACDAIQVYIKEPSWKRYKWSALQVMLSYDKETGTVTVPGKGNKQTKAAIEDIRVA